MGEKERFDILNKEEIDKNVYYYLKNLFEQLKIEILGKHEGKLFDLMKRGLLEGWCWQTTETAALFMPDDDMVYRGNLYFDEYDTYYHGFIVFNYEDKKYVFDPSLGFINSLDLYLDTFNVDIKGKVSAKEIKNYFINFVNNSPKKDYSNYSDKDMALINMVRELFFDPNREPEIVIYGKEDPNDPMYRNGSGYKNINIENNKVKSLTVHYYMDA